jgi:hypothetical protein
MVVDEIDGDGWEAVIVNNGRDVTVLFEGPADVGIDPKTDNVFWGTAAIWYDADMWKRVIQAVIDNQ